MTAGVTRSTRPYPCWLKSLHNFAGLFTASARFAACYDHFPEHMVRQPRSLEGVTGGIRRWSGVRRLRLRALQARGSGGSGIRPAAQRPLVTTVTTDDGHAQRQCWKRAVKGSATPQAGQRRAERRRALRSLGKNHGNAHAAGGFPATVHCYWMRYFGAPRPRLCRGDQNPPRKGGTTTASCGAELRRGRSRLAV